MKEHFHIDQHSLSEVLTLLGMWIMVSWSHAHDKLHYHPTMYLLIVRYRWNGSSNDGWFERTKPPKTVVEYGI